MAMLRLRGALQSLNLDIPLGSLVAVTSSDAGLAERLAFGVVAAAGQRQMAPLLAPTWLPTPGVLANAEAGSVEGLRPTFVFRHEDSVWPGQTRVVDVLGLIAPIAQLVGRPILHSCELCAGEGRRAAVDVDSLVDGALSLADGAVLAWSKKNPQFYAGVLDSLASSIGLDLNAPWDSLSEAMQGVVLYGAPETNYKGVIYDVEKRLVKSAAGRGNDSLATLSPFLQWVACDACDGLGLDAATLEASAGDVSVASLLRAPIGNILSLLEPALNSIDTGDAAAWSGPITAAVRMAVELGLGGLSVGGWTSELESALACRLRVVQVLSSGLQNALFVVESPTAGMDDAGVAALAGVLRARVSAGDSLLVTSQDRRLLTEADWIIEIGLQRDSLAPELIAEGASRPQAD